MAVNPQPEDKRGPQIEPIPPDPRVMKQIKASCLKLKKRVQRDLDVDRSRTIGNEWDWDRAEVPTVDDNGDGTYDVDEAQHRVCGVQLRDQATGADTLIWCVVLPNKQPAEQAQLALDIAKGRKGHSQFDQWMLRVNANHPHEKKATAELTARGLRIGRSVSTNTIGCVARVKKIIHGGNFTPEYGASLLGVTVDIIDLAFPKHDHESSSSRWEADILWAVSEIVHRNRDTGIDYERLAERLRIRPAQQWINLSRPNELQGHVVIATKLMDQYNKGKRRGRLSW